MYLVATAVKCDGSVFDILSGNRFLVTDKNSTIVFIQHMLKLCFPLYLRHLNLVTVRVYRRKTLSAFNSC